jgi:hypothetical protein
VAPFFLPATILSKNRNFQPTGCFGIPILHSVGIYIEGDGWRGVPKLSLNIFDVFPVLKAEAGIGMPEIVKADWRDRPRLGSRGGYIDLKGGLSRGVPVFREDSKFKPNLQGCRYTNDMEKLTKGRTVASYQLV